MSKSDFRLDKGCSGESHGGQPLADKRQAGLGKLSKKAEFEFTRLPMTLRYLGFGTVPISGFQIPARVPHKSFW
jgi:hypothetical protein